MLQNRQEGTIYYALSRMTLEEKLDCFPCGQELNVGRGRCPKIRARFRKIICRMAYCLGSMPEMDKTWIHAGMSSEISCTVFPAFVCLAATWESRDGTSFGKKPW